MDAQKMADSSGKKNIAAEKISVIMPVHNMRESVERAVKAVRNQTYGEWELIIIDDGSDDGSSELCRDLAGADGRIFFYRTERQGVSAARNEGLQRATGKWVAFADADDEYCGNAFAALISGSEGFDVIQGAYREMPGGFERRTGAGGMELEEIPADEEGVTGLYRCGFFLTVWNKLYRREKILHGFDTAIDYGEDTVFNLMNYKNMRKFRVVDEVTYIYHSSSRFRENGIDGATAVYQKHLELYPDNEALKRHAATVYYTQCLYYVQGLLSCGELPAEKKKELIRHFHRVRATADTEYMESILYDYNRAAWEILKKIPESIAEEKDDVLH